MNPPAQSAHIFPAPSYSTNPPAEMFRNLCLNRIFVAAGPVAAGDPGAKDASCLSGPLRLPGCLLRNGRGEKAIRRKSNVLVARLQGCKNSHRRVLHSYHGICGRTRGRRQEPASSRPVHPIGGWLRNRRATRDGVNGCLSCPPVAKVAGRLVGAIDALYDKLRIADKKMRCEDLPGEDHDGRTPLAARGNDLECCA